MSAFARVVKGHKKNQKTDIWFAGTKGSCLAKGSSFFVDFFGHDGVALTFTLPLFESRAKQRISGLNLSFTLPDLKKRAKRRVCS